MDILSFWKDNISGSFDEQKEAIVVQVLRKFELEATDEIKISLKRKLSSCFFNNYKLKYNLLPRNKKNYETFEIVYEKWLQKDFCFEYVESARINTEAQGNYLLYH